MKKIYAVAEGYHTGIFSTWEDCKREINGYSGARFKRFGMKEAAKKWLAENISDNKEGNIKAPSKYYAVAVGRQVGVFSTWEECKSSVDGYSRARHKSFTNEQDAYAWLEKINSFAE